MNTKMKGLLKGLRYISQIFESKEEEEEEEEEEMQIGFPTDVKHVAHIGWDGPSVSPPTWMNEFRSAPLSTLGEEAMGQQPSPRFPSHVAAELNQSHVVHQSSLGPNSSSQDRTALSSSRQAQQPEQPVPIKTSRRHSASSSAMDSAAPGAVEPSSSGAPRHSRRNKSTEAMASGQAEGSSSRGSGRRQGRASKEQATGTEVSAATPQDLPSIPKVRKKKKPAAGEGSSRSSRSKAAAAAANTSGISDPASPVTNAERSTDDVRPPHPPPPPSCARR